MNIVEYLFGEGRVLVYWLEAFDIMYQNEFYIVYKMVLVLIFAYMAVSSIWITRPQGLRSMKEWGITLFVLLVSFLISECYAVRTLLELNHILFLSDLFVHINLGMESIYLSVPFTYAGIMIIAMIRKKKMYQYGYQEIFILILFSIFYSRLLCLTTNTAVKRAYLSPIALGMTGLGLVIVILYFFSILVFFRYFIQKENEKELLEVNRYMSKTLQYYENQIKVQTEIYSMYHDIKKHFSVVSQMKDIDEVHSYIEELYGNLTRAEQYYHTGSNMADIVLNDKKQIAQTAGITMEVIIEEGCLCILKNEDICTIFANALDNALEACQKQSKNPKYIIVKAFERQDFLMISIKNSIENCPYREWGELVTEKKEQGLHGYGIKSIQLAVEKYQGEVRFSNTDCEFILSIVIDKREEQKFVRRTIL